MSERVPLVTFALGDDMFAAPVAEVERVLRVRDLERMPGVPEWLAGFMEYDVHSLPVVDLRRRFGLPPAPGSVEPRVVVSGTGGHRMGLLVDRVVDVAPVDASLIEPPPPVLHGLPGEYIRGTFRRDGQLVVVLRMARLLSATERLMLSSAATEG